MRRFTFFITMGVISTWFSLGGPAHALTVTQLEFTKGAVNYDGKYHQAIDRLLGQDGALSIGEYQAIGKITPTIDEGSKTFSLFTSGFSSAPAPTAKISGSSIEIDLSSLFFSVGRGDSYRAVNIGGLATGLFNPDTKEFFVSWDRLLDGAKKEGGEATFFLSGVAQSGAARLDAAPVPIPAGLLLYGTGLLGLGSWARWRRHAAVPAAA